MDRPDVTARRVAATAGYLLLGIVGTALVALGLLALLQPVQPMLYLAAYIHLGPSDATTFATLGHFVFAGAVAIAVPTLVGEYAAARGANLRSFGVAFSLVAGSVVLFVAVSLAGLAAVPIALLWAAAVGVTVPLVLRFRLGVRSGGVLTFVGGVPVLVLLFLLAGFGLGWGWGYVLTAEEVPASEVGDGEVADFESVPQVREDLFTGDCSGTAGGGRTCYLQLRGYEHEMVATRFLARHGVRCPYRGSGRDAGSFVARHDGSYYRVSCGSHGD